ncbi:hypothetical protein BC834DRAFT_684695 [Gloeopeniophorella convolvens]|nr:hypothetical protein BC834DRAFT_684695 [Gloeopeniophorella convolvens]
MTRSPRYSAQPESVQPDSLNNLERLILAQAVYELGSEHWDGVARILSQHPLVNKRDSAAFSPSACQAIYDLLLKDVGLDSSEAEKQPRNAHSNNLKLAQRMYQARVVELRQLILAEEARFKCVFLSPSFAEFCALTRRRSVAAEIEAIRAGRWDSKVTERLAASEDASEKPLNGAEEPESDLTGVSDSSPSVSHAQIDQPVPEEEAVQRQLNEDVPMADLPHISALEATGQDDAIAAARVPETPSQPSPAAGTHVDEEVHPPPSPQPSIESPDPLDVIPHTDEDGEDGSASIHGDSETVVAPPASSPLQDEHPDDVVPAEGQQSDVTESSEVPEDADGSDSVEHAEPSESTERPELEGGTAPAEHAGTPSSHSAVEETPEVVELGASSAEDVLVASPEPAQDIHSEAAPSPVEEAADEAMASAVGTPQAEDVESEAAVPGSPEVKDEEMQPDDNQPEETQENKEDMMDVEPLDEAEVASSTTEPPRRECTLRTHSSLRGADSGLPDKRKVSEATSTFSDSTRDRKKAREDSQPVDEEEPGPVRRRGRPPAGDSQTSKKFQTVIIMVHSQISQHRNGNIFHNPIKTSEAPDYYEIVKRPMDLKTVKARIREGQISNSAEFQRDVYLMFANSLMYNRPGSDIYTMAEEMMLESEAQINTFRQTEGIIKGGHR